MCYTEVKVRSLESALNYNRAMTTRYLSVLILFVTLLFADTDALEEAKARIQAGKYQEANVLLETLPNDPEALYMRAQLYEDGLGVTKDPHQAAQLYKAAATAYADQQQPSKQAIVEQLASENPQIELYSKKILERRLSLGPVELRPYHTNYFLPVQHKTNGNYSNTVPNGSNVSATEAQFQISLMFNFGYDLLGFNEIYSLAYTQLSFWQIYVPSKYFRETNYQPELFVTVPITQSHLALDGISAGYMHQSNGRGGEYERSWNRLFTTFLFDWDAVSANLRLWYRIPEGSDYDPFSTPDGDHNPDIEDYLGYGDIQLWYYHGKSIYHGTFMYGFEAQTPTVEFDWSYPIDHDDNFRAYLQLFSGYGQSLIDYNSLVNSVAVGFSFSH
jgi:phospholipase A1